MNMLTVTESPEPRKIHGSMRHQISYLRTPPKIRSHPTARLVIGFAKACRAVVVALLSGALRP